MVIPEFDEHLRLCLDLGLAQHRNRQVGVAERYQYANVIAQAEPMYHFGLGYPACRNE
ncbi:hypothetical protein [Bosea sp. NPDC055594]